MEVGYGTLDEPSALPASPSDIRDQNLLSNGNKVDKVSGKAWGRVKNIFTRKSRYPLSVFFILGTEFCERFCYYGLRTILVFYLKDWLLFSHDSATAIYHGSSMLAYFSPVIGAIIADGYIGRYRTILYLSIVYCIGNLILALTALPPPEQIGPIVGLLIIGIGTGGIKPCVSSFGGDQFHASQEKERTTFFSVFYFMINLGSVLSTLITPMLRADVHCIDNTCYPLAFGVPALLMFLAIVIFIAGTRLYKRNPPTGNIIGKVIKCIWHALCRRCQRSELMEKKTHWLELADDKYEDSFIEDVKALLKVLWLFLPLPIFWALFDQQGSRWTLQAEEMNGSMGKLGRLKPDQFQVINPLLIILLIPIFENAIYPILDICRLSHRPLQRMVVGMGFGVLAFAVAGFVQIKIDAGKEAVIGPGESGITLFNTQPCNMTISSPIYNGTLLPQEDKGMFLRQSGSMTMSAYCAGDTASKVSQTFQFLGGQGYRVVVMATDGNKLFISQFDDKRSLPKNGKSGLSVISSLPYNSTTQIKLVEMDGTEASGAAVMIDVTRDNATDFLNIEPYRYKVFVPLSAGQWKAQSGDITLESGGTYTLTIVPSSEVFTGEAVLTLHEGRPANELSMFLLVPQYLIITIGEVLFSVTGLAFAYSQAPNGLKSVVQAAWLTTTAVGDLVVVIVAEVQLLPTQSSEFFLFAALMAAATVIFAIMTRFYHYQYMTLAMSASDSDESGLVDNGVKEDIPLQDRSDKDK